MRIGAPARTPWATFSYRPMSDIRLARRIDRERLCEVRRHSIQELAISGMTPEQARTWADSMTTERWARKVAGLEVWVAEPDGEVVGWVGVQGDRIDGMYVDPRMGRGR